MDFTKDRYLLEIAHSGTISAASKRLYVSQPYLSRILSETEAALGVRLFDRNQKPLTPTKAGERYFKYVTEMIQLEQNLKHDLSLLTSGNTPTLTIGMQPILCQKLLPYILPRLYEEFPQLSCQVLEMLAPEIRAAISQQKIELGLLNTCKHPKSLPCEICSSEPLLLAFPIAMVSFSAKISTDPSHPLQFPANFYPLLREFRIILPASQTDLGDFAREFLNEHQIPHQNALVVGNLTTALQLASNEVGITFTLPTVASHTVQKSLAYFTIGKPPHASSILFTYPNKKTISPYAAAFMKLARESFQ